MKIDKNYIKKKNNNAQKHKSTLAFSLCLTSREKKNTSLKVKAHLPHHKTISAHIASGGACYKICGIFLITKSLETQSA